MGWYLLASDIRTDTDLTMKFLVLALCVCAASAASFGSFGTGASTPYQYKPFAPARAAAKATVQVFGAPVVQAAKIITPVPVAPVQVDPVPYSSVPVAPAAKTYNYNNNNEGQAEIIRNESEVESEGYRYYYETNNGIVGEATGSLRPVGDSQALVVSGSYKYYSPDGTPVVINYVADENGYQPQGDSIPVGPEIPEAIVRSLKYIASHQAAEPYKNVKQY